MMRWKMYPGSSSVEGPIYTQQKQSISKKNLLSEIPISWEGLC